MGGETDLVIRTDTEADSLIISSSITAPNLTKSGGGVLLLSGSNHITGTTAINDGFLVAAKNSVFGTGSVAVQAGAVLVVGSGVSLPNPIHLEGGVLLKETAAGDALNSKPSAISRQAGIPQRKSSPEPRAAAPPLKTLFRKARRRSMILSG